jgi:hypothetical protein
MPEEFVVFFFVAIVVASFVEKEKAYDKARDKDPIRKINTWFYVGMVCQTGVPSRG